MKELIYRIYSVRRVITNNLIHKSEKESMSQEVEIEYLTESELRRIEEKHSIVLWGAGVLWGKTQNTLHNNPVCYLDNSFKLQGTLFQDIQVEAPEDAVETLILISASLYDRDYLCR